MRSEQDSLADFQNALARRNLPPKWLQYIIGKEYLEKKKAPFEANGTVGQIDPRTGKPERTSAEVARKHKVSEATVRRAAKVAQKVHKESAGSHAKKAEILNSKRTKAKKKPGFDHKMFDKNFGWISRQVDVYAEKQGHTGTALQELQQSLVHLPQPVGGNGQEGCKGQHQAGLILYTT